SRRFESHSLPALTRSYPLHFTLITRTASCSRQLPYLRCRLPALFPDRDVFYVTHPIDSFAPALSPSRVCPSMSRLPSTLHSLHSRAGRPGGMPLSGYLIFARMPSISSLRKARSV